MFWLRKYFKIILLFSSVIIIVSGCKKGDSNPVGNNTPLEFAGTWKLTQVSTILSGQTVTMTPEIAGTQMTIISRQDGTFSMNSFDPTTGSPIVSTGTWSINGNNLTLKYSDNTSVTLGFTLSANSLSIKDYPYTHPLYGPLLVTLIFTKQ